MCTVGDLDLKQRHVRAYRFYVYMQLGLFVDIAYPYTEEEGE